MNLERRDNGEGSFATIPDFAHLSPETMSSVRDNGFDHDTYHNNPRYQDLSAELRNILLATAQSACPSRASTPNFAKDVPLPLTTASAYHKRPQLDVRRIGPPAMDCARYLRNWLTECAPWLDMFDRRRVFGSQVTTLAQTSAAVLYAMLALSARQEAQQKLSQKASEDSFALYAKAVESLSAAFNTRDRCTPVAACILCVLEMMSANPRNWRHHLEGCAALFEASGIHGLSGGLEGAVFWCFARMDLCSAIIDSGVASTVIPIEKWAIVSNISTNNDDFDKEMHSSKVAAAFRARMDSSNDMRANHAVYLCARVCDLLAKRTRYTELGKDNGYDIHRFVIEWNKLWVEVEQWMNDLPEEFLPLATVVDEQGFPHKFFSQYAAISSSQLYHTACILLLEARDPGIAGFVADGSNNAMWHAKQVVGISLANEHKGCLNNAIQPLYIAGKMFTHGAEHVTVVQLLHKIERESGWHAKWRIKDLKTAWGCL
jgi:hypothetical protein